MRIAEFAPYFWCNNCDLLQEAHRNVLRPNTPGCRYNSKNQPTPSPFLSEHVWRHLVAAGMPCPLHRQQAVKDSLPSTKILFLAPLSFNGHHLQLILRWRRPSFLPFFSVHDNIDARPASPISLGRFVWSWLDEPARWLQNGLKIILKNFHDRTQQDNRKIAKKEANRNIKLQLWQQHDEPSFTWLQFSNISRPHASTVLDRDTCCWYSRLSCPMTRICSQTRQKESKLYIHTIHGFNKIIQQLESHQTNPKTFLGGKGLIPTKKLVYIHRHHTVMPVQFHSFFFSRV